MEGDKDTPGVAPERRRKKTGEINNSLMKKKVTTGGKKEKKRAAGENKQMGWEKWRVTPQAPKWQLQRWGGGEMTCLRDEGEGEGGGEQCAGLAFGLLRAATAACYPKGMPRLDHQVT